MATTREQALEDDGCPSVEAALAYAEGHAAGLNEAENADAAQLLIKNGALETRLSFEWALKSDTERQLAEHKAWRAEEVEEHKVEIAALQRKIDEVVAERDCARNIVDINIATANRVEATLSARIETLEAALRELIDNVETGSYESTGQAIDRARAVLTPTAQPTSGEPQQ